VGQTGEKREGKGRVAKRAELASRGGVQAAREKKEKERGERELDRAGSERKENERDCWAGPKEIGKRKKRVLEWVLGILFCKLKHINKKKLMQRHECKTNRTTSSNLEIQPIIFFPIINFVSRK
jgi:hypothetical protein